MSHTVDWQACGKCGHWTKKKTDRWAKCYAGYCPAKLRDDAKQKTLIKDKEQNIK